MEKQQNRGFEAVPISGVRQYQRPSQMSSSSSPKHLKVHCFKRDRISELPDCVILSILSLLPLKEVVLTSVLSKRWKHVWTLLPDLTVKQSGRSFFDYNDRTDGRSHLNPRLCDKEPSFAPIGQLLASHAGTLRRCRIDSCSCPVGDAARWLPNLLPKYRGIQQLELHFTQHHYPSNKFVPIIPNDLFSLQFLTSLKLSYCEVEPPNTPELLSAGFFQELKHLDVHKMVFRGHDTFDWLIFNCRDSLEKLYIYYCCLLQRRVIIDSPQLKDLAVCSYDPVGELSVLAPKLERFYGRIHCHPTGGRCTSDKLLKAVAHVKTLVIRADFLKWCPSSCLRSLESLGTTFSHLQHVTLEVYRGGEMDASSLLSCLLGNSPHLQNLSIFANSAEYPAKTPEDFHSPEMSRKRMKGSCLDLVTLLAEYWSKQPPFHCVIHTLECVYLHLGTQWHWKEFAKFLLFHSRMLKTMIFEGLNMHYEWRRTLKEGEPHSTAELIFLESSTGSLKEDVLRRCPWISEHCLYRN